MWVVTKGFFYLGSWWQVIKGLFYLGSELWRPRGFLTLIWVVKMSIKWLFYFNMYYVDQRALLLQSGLLKWRSKGLSYFDLDCWEGDQMAFLLRSGLLRRWSNGFSTSIWTVEILIKGVFYFNLDCSWNGNQRAFLLQSELFLKWRLNGFSTSI